MQNPLISVILPVYNSEKYIYSSINSILQQTFTQFELLILNDGSTDSSAEIINSFQDPRIRFFSHENIGLSATLNRGINLSRASLIARQDADDISHPSRFDLQFKYMENNPDCSLLGTAAQIIDTEKLLNRYVYPPKNDIDCKFELSFKNCFIHTSVIIRKSILNEVGLYSTSSDRSFVEDYDLWSRISLKSKVANLIDTLVYYRSLPDSLSKQNELQFNSCLINICSQNLCRTSGRSFIDPIPKSLASILYGPPFCFNGFPNFNQIDQLIFSISYAFKSSPNYNLIIREAWIRCIIYRIYWFVKCTPIKYILNLSSKKSNFLINFWQIIKEKFIFKRIQ